MQMTQVMQEILDLVEQQLQINYIPDSLSYQRFITHLKFFALRMHARKTESGEDDTLCNTIKSNYATAWRCAKKIEDFLRINYHYDLERDELVYLTLHIERIRKCMTASAKGATESGAL